MLAIAVRTRWRTGRVLRRECGAVGQAQRPQHEAAPSRNGRDYHERARRLGIPKDKTKLWYIGQAIVKVKGAVSQ